ncbi:hypothetical protein C4K03_4390 [Pseudomonas synxantha]|uniref:Uncharacterized protein n=1 Tax=Pseudomonas synxantha TaxID=47883 RepID=A0A3G7USQ0_9PSED|nr:hypothetical protein C4K03_4390 [Pseudomonas synxantha]AZE62367.1 hypothetical protein C4K02_4022 [Pseudomonas synxantha]
MQEKEGVSTGKHQLPNSPTQVLPVSLCYQSLEMLGKCGSIR